MDLVKACISPHGFLASPVRNDNYRRIWTRDGVIIGLALKGKAVFKVHE
jgi:hypothetical protein